MPASRQSLPPSPPTNSTPPPHPSPSQHTHPCVSRSATAITILDTDSKPVTKVCASKAYSISVTFPEERLSYVTLNAGKVAEKNAANKK